MSLILDAINKSEREKDTSEAVPDLQTIHSREQPSNNAQKTWMVLIAALLVGLLTVLLVLLVILQKSPKPSGDSVSPPSAQRPLEGVQEKNQQAATGQAQQNEKPMTSKVDAQSEEVPSESPSISKEVKPPSDEVAALYGDAQEAQPLVIEPTTEPATVIQPSQNSVDEELARQLWQETQRLMPTRRVASNREQTEVTEPETPPATLSAPFDDTMAAYEGTPFLHELSVSVQNSIPTLMYALHKYDEQQVVINKKTYRQGDDLGAGVVIERILADGLILNVNSYQFKLAALNSWVNY